jgi:hypothetical protein
MSHDDGERPLVLRTRKVQSPQPFAVGGMQPELFSG